MTNIRGANRSKKRHALGTAAIGSTAFMGKAAVAATASLSILAISTATLSNGRLIRWVESTAGVLTSTRISAVKPTPAPMPGTPTPAPGSPPGSLPMKLGINLTSPVYYEGTRPFMNLVTGSSWEMISNGVYQAVPADRLDANHNLVKLLPGEQVNRVLTRPTASFRGKSVDIVCRWQGKGSGVHIFGAPVANSRNTSSNSLTFTWMPSTSFPVFRYSGIDAADPIRAIDCREKDADPTALFDPTFLAEVKRYSTIRFVKWMPSAEANTAISWATRTKPGDGIVYGADSVPVEYMVALANQTKTNPWFNISWNADADYVRKFATYVRDNLDPTLVAHVENSNEVWNWGYPVTHQALQEAKAANLNNGDDNIALWYRNGQKAGEVMDIWKSVYGDANKHRLVRVLAMQNAYSESSRYLLGWGDIAKKFDALATAPYFDATFSSGQFPTLASAESFLVGSKGLVDSTLGAAKLHKETAAKYGLRYITYEAGQHFTSPADVQPLEWMQRSAKMGDMYSYYLSQWRDNFGDLMVLFMDYGGAGRYGAWGNQEYIGQPLSEAPKANAIENFRKSYLQ